MMTNKYFNAQCHGYLVRCMYVGVGPAAGRLSTLVTSYM